MLSQFDGYLFGTFYGVSAVTEFGNELHILDTQEGFVDAGVFIFLSGLMCSPFIHYGLFIPVLGKEGFDGVDVLFPEGFAYGFAFSCREKVNACFRGNFADGRDADLQ